MIINPDSMSLAELIRTSQKSHGSRLRVALPGKVVSYNSKTHLATVQPLLMDLGTKEFPETLPPVPRVPIAHPRTAAGAVFLPVAKGDLVTLLFSDRALDAWKAGVGQPVDPDNTRQHDLSDCWAIPGGYPEGAKPGQRFPGALEVWLKPGTKFAVGNGTAELLAVIDDLASALGSLLSAIQAETHTSALGYPTGPPLPPALVEYIAAKAALDAAQAKLAGLRT